MRRALITGITGQDGRYLADLLHRKGYEIYGLVTGQRDDKADNLAVTHPYVRPLSGDLRDLSSLVATVETARPDEVYNLGAISFVKLSFQQPDLTSEVTGLGVMRLLQAVRMVGGMTDNPIRFYQASSSEMFGQVRETPQNEETPFHPRSPYGVAKTFGHYTTVNYREAYGLFACSGILFNHESPLRGPEFVTRKITRAVARIRHGLQDRLTLGNLDARRDWGFAGDFVEAMWLMLQQPAPSDYVIATGESHSVREFLELAFASAGLKDWRRYVDLDPRFLRPSDIDDLVGDSAKARRELGWKSHVALNELVDMMVRHDLATVSRS
jgi:GDPmannose 4,6-dehydratase